MIASLFAALISGCNHESELLIEIPDPLEIRVIGKDFYWHFLYPGPDQAFGTEDDFTISQDIYVPLDHPVKLSITSEDYIYFFRVPDYKLRQAAIPDLNYEIKYTPNQIGLSKLEVDPMCSAWSIHKDGSMGDMHILTEDEFKDWQKKRILGR